MRNTPGYSRRSLLLGCTTAVCSLSAQQEYVVRSNSNLVVLDVSVTRTGGAPVAGLTKDQFQVIEDGKIQVVKQFSAAEVPVSIGFLIDMSGSMRSKLPGVRQATSTFLQASNPKDEYFLIGFNDRAWVGLPTGIEFSSNGDDIRKALSSVHSVGKTALYDGISLALTHVARSVYERRVLVLITDGKDNASSISLNDALQQVRSAPVTIYTIGLFADDDEDSNRKVLRQLAKSTGGYYYQPATPDAIVQDCESIARDVRARYTIAYTPPAQAKSAIRKIRVDLPRATSDPQRLIVHARSEYTLDARGAR